MNHPIFQTRAFLAYMVAWLVLAASQAGIVTLFLGVPLENAALDALASHLWAAALGLSLWYALAYHVFKHELSTALLHHVVLGTAYAFIWAEGTRAGLGSVYANNPTAQTWLDLAHPWRIAAGFIYYTLLVLTYSLFHSMSALHERIANESRLQSLLHQSELSLLKSQLNPHFLFNSLNSVSALVELDPPKAQKMISSLADYLRYSISGSANATVPLEDELRNVSRYLSIEQIRFGDRLVCQDQISPDCLQVRVPSMILQPLYENAIKHGISECRKGAVIETVAQRVDDYLMFEIRNSLEKESTRKGTGLGQRNVRERLRLFYGEGKSRMTVTSDNGLYSVKLYIPLQVTAHG